MRYVMRQNILIRRFLNLIYVDFDKCSTVLKLTSIKNSECYDMYFM